MNLYLNGEQLQKFKGITMDNCAKRTSIMSKNQYSAYCNYLRLKSSIRKDENRTVRGIVWMREAIGSANIQIKFKELQLVIYLVFFY